MADRENQPPASPGAAGLSADEADRLSEKFRPSWEAENEKPAVEPTPEPRKPAKQTLIGGISPFAAPGSDPPPAAPTSEPPAPTPASSSRPPAKHTLIGIAPPSNPPPAPATTPKAPTSSPVTAGGSPDGPSGIAKIYRPKDDPAAPPVVLTEEVQKAEAATSAEIEAKRRAQSSQRHMQTVMNIKAPDFAELVKAQQKKKKSGVWQLLIGVLAGVVVVGAVFILTKQDGATTEPASLAPAAEAPVETAAPATTAEPGTPAVTPGAPAEDGQPKPVVLPAETASGDSVATGAEAQTAAPRSAAKPAAASSPKKPAPKTTTPAPEPAPAPTPAKKGGVIIRDTPF